MNNNILFFKLYFYIGELEEYLTQKFSQNYENAETILTLLFAFFDSIIILFSLFNLKSKNKKIYLLKYKLFILFIIDIILRILYAMKFYKVVSLYKECLFSGLNSIQFYLILSFLEQSFNNIIFSIVTFSYDKFSYSQKEICFIQSLSILYCVYILYISLKNKITKIVENIVKQTTFQDRRIFFCILGSPLPCVIFFITYYILRIVFLFLKNQDLIIYANIILKIIKDSSKYFLFFILEILLYAVSKIKMEKNKLSEELQDNNQTKCK